MSQLRALFISPMGTREKNGMMQRQHQTLSTLCELYDGAVDVLSLGASPDALEKWLQASGLHAKVIKGLYASLARFNTSLWYGGGVVLCNKLRAAHRFRFPLRTPIPRSWIDRYEIIVCYYPWGYNLLRLDHAGGKVVMDLADIMADRHERIGTRRWISLHADDERKILRSASRCMAISVEDSREFEHRYGVQPSVVPFTPPEWRQLATLVTDERPSRVGYMGAPSYHNEIVLRLLARLEFLECLSAAGIELVVAGGICDTVDDSVLQSLERGGARVLGRIRSIVDFYAQISTLVNPVGPSTGAKIKSIEALMAGRKLITTRWGADESLTEAFSSQIQYIEWPIDSGALGELTVKLLRSTAPVDFGAIRKYADESAQALGSILSK